MMRNKKMIMLAVVLLLAIGFATVATVLTINGSVGVSTNPDDFVVKFINAEINGAGTANIVDDGKRIVFVSDELKRAEDKAELNYTILNNSSQYDAEAEITCYGVDNLTDLNKVTIDNTLLKVTNTLSTFTIEAKQTKDGKLTAELLKPVTENTNLYIACDIVVNATGRTSSGIVDASQVSIDGITDKDGNQLLTVSDALDYLYENR